MTGTLPDATNRPARLLAETRKRPCRIGQHYWPGSRTLHEANLALPRPAL